MKLYCPKCKKTRKMTNVDGGCGTGECSKCGLKYEEDVECQEDYEDIAFIRNWEDGTQDYEESESDIAYGGF